MPFTRISLNAGRSAEELSAISDGLHRALVDSFDVPADDRFQAIHQHGPGELVFDRTYMGGPRSDGFVLFAVQAGLPRSGATKKAFFKRLVQLLGEKPGIRQEDVMVVITTSTPDEWSFAYGEAQLVDGDVRPISAA